MTFKKKYLVAYFIWFCVGVIWIVLLKTGKFLPIHVILGGIIGGSVGLWVISFKCPYCNTPISHRKVKLLGREVTLAYSSWVPKKCCKCGNELK